MKLSLRWIFDHIDANYSDFSVDEITKKFNVVTAEIEHVDHVVLPFDSLALATVEVQGDIAVVTVPEKKDSILLPLRSDFSSREHCAYFIWYGDDTPRWATLKDLGLDKDGLVPAVEIPPVGIEKWREYAEQDDYLLDVDNKSITHRPDMWGHRGFAREIAAFMVQPFSENLDDFLTQIKVIQADADSITDLNDDVLRNEARSHCSMLAGLTVSHVEQRACDVFQLMRFVKIGYKPIDGIVDLTNYVMADWGHPMHAYDKASLKNKELCVRFAKEGEELVLLDGKKVKLADQDLIIADKDTIFGLAGIMGGKNDSVSASTNSLLLEAGCFHAATIRRTATRLSVRTEASQRFEKTLDPQMTFQVIQRFIYLAEKIGLPLEYDQVITGCGKDFEQPILMIFHEDIINRIGIDIEPDKITDMLLRLQFEAFNVPTKKGVVHRVGIPSFRASKDVSIMEDIVEEVARSYGYDSIEPELPKITTQVGRARKPQLLHRIRDFFAYGSLMKEQRNYAFFNEPFLAQIGWKTSDTIHLKNPVSQDARRMVNSLLPQLLYNIEENSSGHETLRFFEIGRVWNIVDGAGVEKEQLAAVWYERRNTISLYDIKPTLFGLAQLLGVTFTFESVDPSLTHDVVWFDPAYSAVIKMNGNTIGFLGRVAPQMLQQLSVLPESDAYALVLDIDPISRFTGRDVIVKDLPKYQDSTFDVSMSIAQSLQVGQLQPKIQEVSPLITNVSLIDFFEKKEWKDIRSVAFRITLRHDERSLSREEIESVRNDVIQLLEENGATLRG